MKKLPLHDFAIQTDAISNGFDQLAVTASEMALAACDMRDPFLVCQLVNMQKQFSKAANRRVMRLKPEVRG